MSRRGLQPDTLRHEEKAVPDNDIVNGGAVALGHPLGSTGTRMIVTLIHELQKRGKELGLTGACVGGGQGAGSVIKVEG
ncbi:MAG: hypothetical protein IMZ74_09135 [Actinobacteria bacterium]|nr:hypothetical protein [Actinomycetota bacterium]